MVAREKQAPARVKSRVDPTSSGQEDIVESPAVKTSRNDQDAAECRKLRDLITYSERQLQGHRDKRTELLRHFVGPHYGANADNPEPLNLIYSLVSTLVPALVIRPRAKVTTRNEKLMAFAETFRLAIDDELKNVKIDKTLKRAVNDAMFASGVTKTGLRATGAGFDSSGGIAEDPGEIYCDQVDFDDYIIDMTAKERSAAAAEGNRYLVNFEDAMDSGRFDKQALERLHAAKVTSLAAAQGAAVIDGPRPTERQQYELYDQLELIDMYVPRRGQIVTIPGDPSFEMDLYLATADWPGRKSGPYDVFGFTPVAGNMLSLPLVHVIYDLFLLINEVGRKIGRQASRQKDIGLVNRGHEDSGESIRDASDGELVTVTDVTAVAPFSIGGVNEAGYKVVAWLQDWLNRISGNTDILGGLRADSNTLGQDEMNMSNAGVRVNEWRGELASAADSVIEKVASLVWSDPVSERSLEYDLGAGIKILRRWMPGAREGRFEQYGLHVDPYHFREKGPEEMYRVVRMWVADLSQPGLVQAAAAQGMALDVEKVADVLGRYLGIDERDAMFKPIAEIQQSLSGAAGGGGGGAGGNTTMNIGMGRTRAGTVGGQPIAPAGSAAGNQGADTQAGGRPAAPAGATQ